MRALSEPLKEWVEFEEIRKQCKSGAGMIQIAGCVTSQKSHLAYGIGDGFKTKIIVVSSEEKAKQFYEEVRLLDSDTYFYLSKDLLFYHADISGNALLEKRMRVQQALEEKSNITVVLCFDALMEGILPREELKKRNLHISMEGVQTFDEIQTALHALEYERVEQTMLAGQYAIRGGIIDIYPLTEEVPIRIEFWGDEIDSIRTFDVESQRSIENLKEICIYPAGEFEEEQGERVSFLKYFESRDTILFLDEPNRLEEKGLLVEEELNLAYEKRKEEGMITSEFTLFSTKATIAQMNQYASVGFSALETKRKVFKTKAYYSIGAKNIAPYNGSFETLTKDLKYRKRENYRVVLLSGSRTRAKRLSEDLRDYGLSSFYSEDMNRVVKAGEIMVAYGHIKVGYEYTALKFVVISETDIFGRERKKKKRKAYEGKRIQQFSELKIGDYVVHESHGLGIYQGIEKVERNKIEKDYIKIAYAAGGNLYIPATGLDLIQKYASADARKPKLNRLGGETWSKTKSRVKKAVEMVAKDLVELYATRQETQGYVYEQDTVWQREFEEMFPFEETQDQRMAIEDVKADMESTKIMDRLICGDVGYGKTEIAIRAAFKAVQENKQVAYLVPTTVLAQQHYHTFVQRMKDFPVKIELLCRFRNAAQQKKSIEELSKGQADIVIGTHRLLSADVKFKDLGLLVIDEEQRFGVQHKEIIKKWKENIDVMTLSATPIPRTLHMSLIGIRDMSVLEEAPVDRVAIQTYVLERSEEMIREAIQRELSREGQVFYVYNRVEDIASISAKVSKLVPEARVAYAHGRMKENQLEKIMYQFVEGEIDVLVSTTIVETGLDISNANTIIIDDADRMGLSQLYQLRGRVGRSNKMAYAFLLYRREKILKEIAEKRLAAIREYTDLGSGFKIAMRDLEIRGAGNLLGEAQHGHMESVGYDLYCKMLNKAVRHLKNEEEETYSTSVDLNVAAFISSKYIPNEYQKLDIYKRIASIETEEEVDDMMEELIDRFGNIPKEVQTLLQIAVLKNMAHAASLIAVEEKETEIKFIMYEKSKVIPERITPLIEKYQGRLKFYPVGETPYFIHHETGQNKRKQPKSSLDIVKNMLIDIKTLLE